MLQAGIFKLDVTPETGFPIAYGINEETDSKIYIRGLVIDDSKERIVLLSCDFIYIWGSAYNYMKRNIARAAGISASNVFLHSIHQHDSVNIAPDLNPAYKKYIGMEITPLDYYKRINDDLAEAVAEAVENMIPVNKVATAERRIGGLASNRRLLDDNGKVYTTRWSMCHDPELQSQPVGLIDPSLRSIAFFGENGKALAVMHFYASHPMTAYNRNKCGSDVPGVALDYVAEHYDPKTMQLYFTGCGGNITFGKYSLENKEASLKLLGERLGKELLKNCQSLETRKVGDISLKSTIFELPLKPELNEKDLTAKLAKAENPREAVLLSTRLEMVRNWDKWKMLNISKLSIGEDVHILSFPSETVVEYQLYAQSLVPEKFLACAAYACSSYGYIPTAKMYEEGGYEPEYGAVTTVEAEERMNRAIKNSLQELL
jgi:hypothetical protein